MNCCQILRRIEGYNMNDCQTVSENTKAHNQAGGVKMLSELYRYQQILQVTTLVLVLDMKK